MRKGRDGGTGKKKKKGKKKEKTDENSGHYVIASSRPPERRLLERRTLAPINIFRLEAKLVLFNLICKPNYQYQLQLGIAQFQIIF